MADHCNNCGGVSPELALPVAAKGCECDANPTFWRTFRVSVQVCQTWLTGESERSEESGWAELAKELERQLPSLVALVGGNSFQPVMEINFEEWEGTPEEVR